MRWRRLRMSLPGKYITRMEAYPKMDSASSLKRQRRLLRLNREVSFNEVVDLSILREAQKELGIKGK